MGRPALGRSSFSDAVPVREPGAGLHRRRRLGGRQHQRRARAPGARRGPRARPDGPVPLRAVPPAAGRRARRVPARVPQPDGERGGSGPGGFERRGRSAGGWVLSSFVFVFIFRLRLLASASRYVLCVVR